MDKEAQFIYKCRQCGKKFSDVYCGCQSASSQLVNAIYKIVVNNQSPAPMMTIHECSKTKGGVADLVGYKIK